MSAPSTPIVPTGPTGAPLSRVVSSASSAGPPSFTSGASTSTGRKPAQIYDRSLQRKRGDVSLSAFAYLFGEAIQYMHKQSKGISDLEERLNRLGYHVGQRAIELLTLRDGRSAKRETTTLGVLQFVHTTVWRSVFGRPADALEKSTEHQNQYMLVDFDPVVTEYVSVPRDMSQLNCAAYAAGVIEAVLDASLFTAKVSAHSMPTDEHPARTVFLVQFEQQRD